MRTPPRAYNMIDRMLVSTADHDYLTARWAALHQINTNFFWLAQQALEKYMKAILLYNGRTSKGFGHDLVALLPAVRSLDLRIVFPDLDRPTSLSANNPDFHWRVESLGSFIARINQLGDPSNRYGVYGWSNWFPHDLMKLDRVVWQLRRLCRKFSLTIENRKIDELQLLINSPGAWRMIGRPLPLEGVFDRRFGDEVYRALMALNFSFSSSVSHNMGWTISSTESPLSEPLRLIASSDASAEVRKEARDELEWVLDHVQLIEADRKLLRDAIQKNPIVITSVKPLEIP